MGKFTGFVNVGRLALRPAFLLSCLVAASAPAHACRVNPPRPTEAQLRAAPDDAEVAAKAIVRRVIINDQMEGGLRPHFWLELDVGEVFKGEPGPSIKVAYGLCHHILPGEVGQTINVLARRFEGELVAYFY